MTVKVDKTRAEDLPGKVVNDVKIPPEVASPMASIRLPSIETSVSFRKD
jgi:hypothetical protein